MLSALKALFEPNPREPHENHQHHLNLVAAALLIETARADFSQDAAEQAAMEKLLCDSLGLDQDQVRSLMTEAQERVDEAISLYEFTREINDHYTPEQKKQLIEAMWTVAYADGNLGKYEEHLIRQVAELTYVPHLEYIQCKLAAQAKL